MNQNIRTTDSPTFAGLILNGTLDMNNNDITEVNALTFNDPGPNEGINWAGGNLWRIYESPDDLTTNSAGNLQIVQGTTRRGTWDTSGNYTQIGNIYADSIIDRNNNSYNLDPAGSSNLYGLRIYNAFDTATSDVYASVRVIRNNGSNAGNDGMFIGYGNAGGGITRIFGGGATGGALEKYSTYTYEPGSFRAPIFYDSDDTNYYLNPASTSVLNTNVVSIHRLDSNYGERLFGISFPNGTANQAFDIRIGNVSLWGYIEVEITGTYSFQNTPGKLTKSFAIGTNPGNNIYANTSRVSDVMGPIADNISIGEFAWDSGNSTFRIPISHIVSSGNSYTVKIRVFSHGGGVGSHLASMTMSPIYTLSALAQHTAVTFNTNVFVSGEVRGTLFRDIDDNNYYLNPNSTSRIRRTDIVASGAGWDDQLNLYSSDQSNRWNILTDSGASNYLRFAYNNSERFRMQPNGDTYNFGAFLADIYYDRNNTAYYIDPTSTQSIRTVGDWRSDSSTWTGEFAGKIQYHSTNWYFQYAGSFIFRNSGGSNVTYGDTSGNLWAVASMRSPVFYDNDDTTYRVDPNGNSVLVNTFASRYFTLYNNFGDTTNNAPWYGLGGSNVGGPFGGSMVQLAGYYGLRLRSANITFELDGPNYGASWTWTNNNFASAAQVRGTSFYDYNNTAYYLDPNGTSNLYDVYSYSYRGNGNVGGTGNASWHPSGIYSAGYNWLYGGINGGGSSGTNFSDLRANIFYDYNDTNYFIDPNTTATSLRIAGGIKQRNIVGRPYAVWGSSGTTGAVVIKFPGGIGNYGMIHAVIDIYEYNGSAAATVIVGGHNWNGAWYNYNANVVGYTDKQVRVGVKDGRYCISG